MFLYLQLMSKLGHVALWILMSYRSVKEDMVLFLLKVHWAHKVDTLDWVLPLFLIFLKHSASLLDKNISDYLS